MILELRFCQKCNKVTYHEFINYYPFDKSYWQCRDCLEKDVQFRSTMISKDDKIIRRGMK